MRKTGIALGLLSGLLVMIAVIATGTAEAQPALSTSLQTDDENCIACHTSKETLQELAVEPEEEGEELSEGEG
jgi:nitrate/TMAO reductase-like tetraheme cytochrome c subunit